MVSKIPVIDIFQAKTKKIEGIIIVTYPTSKELMWIRRSSWLQLRTKSMKLRINRKE